MCGVIQGIKEAIGRYPPEILSTVKKEKGLGQNSEEYQHVGMSGQRKICEGE